MKKAAFSAIVFFAINFNLSAQVLGPVVRYNGLCEASAGVSLFDNTFIVASDEDNLLRIFNTATPDPLKTVKLSEVFKLSDVFKDPAKDEIKDKPNMDLEGATWIDNRIFWIGSHSVKSDGEAAPTRHRLFAVEVFLNSAGEPNLVRSGQIYTTLIADLEKDPRFAALNLKKARTITPKAIGGLSIEGLAATPEGNLLIGFRNPLIGGEIAPTLPW